MLEEEEEKEMKDVNENENENGRWSKLVGEVLTCVLRKCPFIFGICGRLGIESFTTPIVQAK